MGSLIEINDTLKISKDRGFPLELRVEQHQNGSPFNLEQFADQVFDFCNPDRRRYHDGGTRVLLVEEIDGRWLYWGHAQILRQTQDTPKERTEGQFMITKIYDPEYQRLATINESPAGKSYFKENDGVE